MDKSKNNKYTPFQLTVLVAARVLMGWYCLYEGVVKVMNPNWSSFAYLTDSQGWFAPFFKAMALKPQLVSVIDFVNIWGLTAIGLGLILGCLTRVATLAGIILISLYCLSHPTLIDANYMMPSGETAMWVGKNLLFVALLFILLVFPTGNRIGLDRLWFKKKK